MTTAAFSAYVRQLAQIVPAMPMLVNLCRDPARFAGVFLAGLSRGQPSLLLGDRSAQAMQMLRRDYPDAILVGDAATIGDLRPDLVVPAPEPGLCAPALPGIEAERLAAIVHTSGSTGAPVPHRKNWGALVQRSRAAGRQFDFTEADPPTLFGTVPVQHMYGFETLALLPLHAACSVGCAAVFYPADIAAALGSLPAPRILITTPLQLAALRRAECAMPELRAVISATASLDAALALDAAASWSADIFEIYGATEAGSIASRVAGRDGAWTCYPGIDIHQDAQGVAQVRAAFAEAIPLSDQLELLPDGTFNLIGRQDDLIKMGGRRASLAGLNRALLDIDGVRDGVFIAPGSPDTHPAARMRVFAVAPGIDPDAIMAALRPRIDPAFLPRKVVLIEALPRNEVGKLPRSALERLRDTAG